MTVDQLLMKSAAEKILRLAGVEEARMIQLLEEACSDYVGFLEELIQVVEDDDTPF
ncbi:MAG: hypothetical protein NZ956_00190 [Candidatus Caldarchaeum sp.]|nr:hypothetical protein [Candidatus Caldarchaeum sp.]